MPTTVNPILIRYGGAHKSNFSMNANELNQAASSILRRAKEKPFIGVCRYISLIRER